MRTMGHVGTNNAILPRNACDEKCARAAHASGATVLVMRVRDEDVVLIRLYREPPDIGKRSAARVRLDALKAEKVHHRVVVPA